MLITRIKAVNFYGIKKPIEVIFTKGGTSKQLGYLNSGKEKISLISGFYGANASGKTTILNIFDVINRLMFSKSADFFIDPLTGIKKEQFLLVPNRHNDVKNSPTTLELDFIISDDKYTYSITVGHRGQEIWAENLTKNKKNIFSRSLNKITFNQAISKQMEEISKEIAPPKKSSFLSVVLSDDSSISVFGNIKNIIGISPLSQIKDKVCFITDKRFVSIGQNNINSLMQVAFNVLNAQDIHKEEYLKEINETVKYFEPSFEKIIIEKKDESSALFGAKYQNFYSTLPVTELSSGTRELISFIKPILKILRNGGVVVYDEISNYLHPDMEISLLNLFKNESINKHHAQIFFSSHNHETMDLLGNNQTYIVEKQAGDVVVNKVSDFDVKERDNIKKKYRLGKFGGIPDTIEFARIINNLL
jgi:AAA15 family ATPase/GTPase